VRSSRDSPSVGTTSRRPARYSVRRQGARRSVALPRDAKATSGFEPLVPENADGETQSPESPSADVPELNPFLARILERVTQNERERAT
jgi:hypothetical protein